MKRLLLLGRGGAGKSTLACQLGELLNIPVVELDKVFWEDDLAAMNKDDWSWKQEELCNSAAWILDGDLGPYDVLSVRLRRADTIILLDFPLVTCLIRAVKRSRERMDFWRWLVTWRKIERPKIMAAINKNAPDANLIVLRNQREVDVFLIRL